MRHNAAWPPCSAMRCATCSQESDGSWTVNVVNRRTGEKRRLNAKFVFVGAGGGALPLLQKSGITEVKGFGGFPIGGRFLRTANPVLAAAHQAKVYGVLPLGAPHRRRRISTRASSTASRGCCSGRSPGWSPKFLKQGNVTDLPLSVRPNNLASMLSVGLHAGGSGEVPDRPAAAVGIRSGGRLCANSSPPQSIPTGNSTSPGSGCRSSGGQGQGRRARVRHHGAVGGRRHHRGPARCLAGRVHRGACDARRHGALLLRPLSCRGCPSSRRWCRRWASKLSNEPALFEEVWSWGTKVLKLDKPANGAPPAPLPAESGADISSATVAAE